MDKAELKIAALREAIAQLTYSYEDKIADYRVEIHQLSSLVERLTAENADLKGRLGDNEGVEEKG